MSSITVSISFPRGVIDTIDEKRGTTGRSEFVTKILAEHLQATEKEFVVVGRGSSK